MAVASDIDADALSVKRDERRAAGVSCGAHALHDGYTDLIYVMLPIWHNEFGLGYAELGLLRGLFSGTMASFQIFAETSTRSSTGEGRPGLSACQPRTP